MSQPKHIALSELQTLIKQGIVSAHPLPYWVVAEISELKVNYAGHCYLELVEKGSDNAVPKARASAIIWKSHYAMIASYFRSATGDDLCAGIKVLIKTTVGYHELYGLSLQITDIEPSYTLGDIEAQRRETIARLQREGIYDMNREMELPDVLQRIAVISSAQAAGYRDFMNELGGNPAGYAYHVTLFQAVMQGAQTEESVIAALDAVAGQADDFDTVVVIRGGGSQSDLAAFNGYRLTAHLAQFPLPVLTGIGHDKDRSVSDLVAHTALKTPTAVATFLVEHNGIFETALDALRGRFAELAGSRMQRERRRLTERAYALSTVSTARVRDTEQRLARLRSTLHLRTAMFLQAQRSRCNTLNIIDFAKIRLNDRANRLALFELQLDSKNPERILQMGYALVYAADGHIVKNISMLTTKDTLSVRLRDGRAETRIERIIKNTK